MGGLMPAGWWLGGEPGDGDGGTRIPRAFLRNRSMVRGDYRDGDWTGIMIGYSGATPEWSLATAVQTPAASSQATVTWIWDDDVPADYMTITMPTALAAGGAGNGWYFSVENSNVFQFIVSTTTRRIRLLMQGGAGITATQVRAKILEHANFAAANVVITGDGSTQIRDNLDEPRFSGGADAGEIEAVADSTNKVLTIRHNADKRFSEIAAALDGTTVGGGTVTAAVISGTPVGARPSDPPQSGILFTH